jgi:acetylornithine aminotransferase
MNDIIKKADSVIFQTYARFPIALEKGRGCRVWDTDGKEYIDFVAGVAVVNLGHCHPGVTKAIVEQAEKLFHVSNLFYTLPQTELAEWLVERSFADRVFFCNSGAEANEAAIKLARKYFYDKGETDRYTILTMTQSFHGRTMGAMAATGQDKIKHGFSPMLPGFEFVPYNDIKALEEKMSSRVCAVMLEPVQGEGGIIVPEKGFLKSVRELCDRYGALLIYDEIQTGLGRTGELFCHEYENVAPDIMTLAKALGNGLPIGAMLSTEKVGSAFKTGAHASTFGGTPLITAAALEALRTIEKENILDKCNTASTYFRSKLEGLKARHAVVEDVRGIGLLLGMKLKVEGAPIVNKCIEKGFLINCVQGNTLRFIPPLVISNEEIDLLVECLDEILAGLDIL